MNHPIASVTPINLPIRRCAAADHPRILEIINSAAAKYRGVIPADRWHEPYMALEELQSEIAAGVVFLGCEIAGHLEGVMGIQPVKSVQLIRHAYVSPTAQRGGVGTRLIQHVISSTTAQLLVGTWAAATWAVAFYERNGFVLIPCQMTPTVLRMYWTIPDRQVETSVVLARPALPEKK
jgi:GNAT superfamily N-acetyltransferase